ncbi:MAG: T9SS type A sorting domain-containing protein [Ignavibacteria bacterium]|nr:T9SS type A sorting domain-containing protein [Ignavibacteria bacterium]
MQNFPNPFNPETKINYELPIANYVTLKVYDMTGKEIMTLVNENQNAGRYTATFNGSNLASGMYFYKITAGEFTFVRKMVLIK